MSETEAASSGRSAQFGANSRDSVQDLTSGHRTIQARRARLSPGGRSGSVTPYVSSNQASAKVAKPGEPRARGEGAKRQQILAAATDRFGRDGYEGTKWADIAADVGVGPTALYHYFESKQHCLYVIIDEATDTFLRPSPPSRAGPARPWRAPGPALRTASTSRSSRSCATGC